MKSISRISFAVAFALAGSLLAFAQQPAQAPAAQKQQAEPAPAKPAAKVWTDDNLSSLRSPADDYQIQQAEEKKAQEAAAQQAASKQTAVADASMPKTVQQANGMIADKSRVLTSEQDYLQGLQKRLKDNSATGLEKKRLEWRLKSHTATAQHLASEIKQLQADRNALARKAPAGNSANSAAQPQSP